MKTKMTMLYVMLLSLFVQTNANAQKIIIRPDLAVTNLTVTNVNGNSFTFTYEVTNVGTGSLELSRLYFQTYVSANNVYDAGDLPSGGAIFGNNAPVLTHGQTYSGSWTASSSSSIETYHYLLFAVNLRSGYVNQETNLANNTLAKDVAPSFADLVVSSIVVNNINGNTLSYTYTISNNGASTLYLDRFYFQSYVSQNSVYDGTDVASGGSVFGSAPLTLAPGTTFTGTWSSTVSVSLQTYPYLIFDVRLLSGQVHPQVSLTNDRYVKYLPYSFTDLVVTDITLNSFNPTSSVDFTYTVANGGQTALQLNQFYFQTYLSTDNVYDHLDKPAGGSVFATSAVLTTGNTYSGSWTSSAGVSIQSYPYLIFIVKNVYGVVVYEVSYTNNQYIKYIPTLVVQGFEKSLSKSNAFKVEKNDDVLTLENNVDIDQQTSYIVYSIAGEKISEGSFVQKKEINTSALKNGIYILHLTNGYTNESVKFVVQQ